MDTQDKVLAVVGDKQIMASEVEEALVSMGQRAQSYNNPQGRAAILDQLISRKLFLMEAQSNLFEREPEFKAQLARVKEDMLANYAIRKAVERVRVTDDEIKKFYDENPDKFVAGTKYNASHILVKDEVEAKTIAEKIASGEITFGDAAEKYSTCPSGKEDGELGDFSHGQMVPEFEQACDALEEGEMSEPVQTQFGWHIIKLNKKEAGGTIRLSDAEDNIREALMNQKQQEAYQSKMNQLKILFPVQKL